MVFRWMDLSDWLAYRCSIGSFPPDFCLFNLPKIQPLFLFLFHFFIVVLLVVMFSVNLSRATGDDTRSLCTTVCKWTYLGHAHMELARETDSRDMEACGWDDVFWEEIGLEDLVEGNHAKIGILLTGALTFENK